MLNIEHSLRISSRERHRQKVHPESHMEVEVSSPGRRGLVQRASESSWGHWRTEQCWDPTETGGGERVWHQFRCSGLGEKMHEGNATSLFPTSHNFEGFLLPTHHFLNAFWVYRPHIRHYLVWPMEERTITHCYEYSPLVLRIFLEVIAQWRLTWISVLSTTS